MKYLLLLAVGIYLNQWVSNPPMESSLIYAYVGDTAVELETLINIPAEMGMKNRERNIWDLQTYNDKLYIGYGSTISNAGPINLYSVDLEDNIQFEIKVKSEAIEKFRVYEDKLYVPFSDPVGGKTNNQKLFIKESNEPWLVKKWAPNLAHVRDVILFRDSLHFFGNTFAPSMTEAEFSGMHIASKELSGLRFDAISKDLTANIGPRLAKWNWFFSAMVYRDTLIMPNAALSLAYANTQTVPNTVAYFKTDKIEWSKNSPLNKRINGYHLYPSDISTAGNLNFARINQSLRPTESIEINDKLLVTYRTYSSRKHLYESSYNNSAGIIIKSSIRDTAQFIQFPEAQAIGEDILVNGQEVYVLTNVSMPNDSFQTIVYKSSNPSRNATDWQEVLRFTTSNMCRSFEFLGDYLYFGQGSNYGDRMANCGRLLRVNMRTACPQYGDECDDKDICTIEDRYDESCNCSGYYLDSNKDGICDAEECEVALFISTSDLNNMDHISVPKSITTNAIISTDYSQIDLRASQYLNLLVGFETQPEVQFEAVIDTCKVFDLEND